MKNFCPSIKGFFWKTLLMVYLILVSTYILFSSEFSLAQHADSIVPILISTVKWEPFYWEQNRFGTLVPLLCIFIENPFLNYMAQSFIHIFCGLSVFFLISKILFEDRDLSLVVGSLSIGFFFFFFDPLSIYNYLNACQPYGVSFFLFCISFLMFKNHAKNSILLACGFISTFLSLWVNISLITFALPLSAGFLLISRERKYAYAGLAIVVAFIVNIFYAKIMALYNTTSLRPLPVGKWGGAVLNIAEVFNPFTPLLKYVFLASIGISFVLLLIKKYPKLDQHKIDMPTYKNVVIFFVSFLIYTIPLFLFKHIAQFNYHPRYFLLSSILLLVFSVSVLVLTFKVNLFCGNPVVVLFIVTISFFTILKNFTVSFDSLPQKTLDRHFGKYQEVIFNQDIHFAVGDYWKVWPTVFHTNLSKYIKGDENKFWGIAHRAAPTKAMWQEDLKDGTKAIVFDTENACYSFPVMNRYTSVKWNFTPNTEVHNGCYIGRIHKTAIKNNDYQEFKPSFFKYMKKFRSLFGRIKNAAWPMTNGKA
jgi:hypothetical protein